MSTITTDDVRLPDDRDAAPRCPYCDRPFADVRARNLHVGEDHPEECTEAERRAYESADEDEREDLFVYHIKAVVAIGLTWAVFVVLYMVALGSGIF
jgi:NAD-dependent SIR2 family protein deacetylase